MKKLLLLFIPLFMILGISAQTEQGVIVLEGNSNLNLGNATVAEYHQSIAEYTHDFPSLLPENVFTTTRFSVNSSYFIINNLAIGATLNYTSTLIPIFFAVPATIRIAISIF